MARINVKVKFGVRGPSQCQGEIARWRLSRSRLNLGHF